jgi:hypothetical protein
MTMDRNDSRSKNKLLVLEQQVRRLRIFGSLALTVLASLFLMGQASGPEATVEAQEINLRDTNGTLRLRLATDNDLSALTLYDADGNGRVHLVAGERPGLLMFDPVMDGPYPRIRLALGVGDMGGGPSDSGPHLLMMDEQGIYRVEMFFTSNKYGLYVNNANGESIFDAP